jgi:amino acid adenylation domain-containing protein
VLVHEFLERSCDRFPEKTALIVEDRRLTYREIDDMANRLAHALSSAGIQKQDRAAIFLDNSVESVISIFGILKAGGIFLVVNPQVKARKLSYVLNDCEARLLVTDTKHLAVAAEAVKECPSLETTLVTDYERVTTPENGKETLETISFYEMLEQSSPERPKKRCIDVDLASLIYTSGTTGNPKGVMLTHLNMVSANNSIVEYLENVSDDIIINCLPLSFDYGLYQALMTFNFGGTIVLEKTFLYPYRVVELMIKEKVTGLPLVPTIAAILLQLENLDKIDFSHLRYLSNTGQALAPSHIEQLRKKLPHVRIYSMYGLTECKRVSYLHPDELPKRPASVGKAMPNTEVFIVDESGGRVEEPGRIGELVVRGSNVMKGYWNLPEETKKKLKPSVYPGEMELHTGDLFKMDEEGFLYFVSRKDDIIKTAGEMVSPKEVENVLYEMEDIVEAAVISVDDEILGRAVKAVVALKEKATATEKHIIRHCAQRLENFMVPKYVDIRKELPKTTSGKISKKELLEEQFN